MKLFGIEETAGGVALFLPSGRRVQVTLAHEFAGAQALGRHVLAAMRSPAEPGTTIGQAPAGSSWPRAAHHLRESAVEVLQPHQGETLPDYLRRVQGSTPAVLFRTLQRMVGKETSS